MREIRKYKANYQLFSGDVCGSSARSEYIGTVSEGFYAADSLMAREIAGALVSRVLFRNSFYSGKEVGGVKLDGFVEVCLEEDSGRISLDCLV